MANRFYSPDQQFLSNSGVPYAGGQLFFYATGTSTPLNTYSDSALTIANTNPVILDSNGQAGSVFLQNLAYKVVLEDVNNNQIWTQDPVYTSDYSAYAQFQAFNGNPNGFVAGTAGTVGTLPGTSVVWDYVHDVLYVATVTGNAATTVWTAVNSNAATAFNVTPQGYLTLASDPNNPILTADVTAATAVYYTPYTGNQIPVYNGASFVVLTFTQLTLTLTSTQSLSTLYDCFVFSNSGVLTLVVGPAWSNSAGGTSARGTGASTTQLQRLNGLWVNAVQISGVNNTTTYTIPANQATYVGSILVDTTAGQVSCYRTWGQSRKWGVWNAYNRVPIYLQAGDSTSSWTYASGTIRPSNGNTSNSITVFAGLPEESYSIQFNQELSESGQTITGTMGIGWNSTTTYSGTQGQLSISIATAVTVGANVPAYLLEAPALGVNVATSLENTANGTTSFLGTQSHMVLSAQYRG